MSEIGKQKAMPRRDRRPQKKSAAEARTVDSLGEHGTLVVVNNGGLEYVAPNGTLPRSAKTFRPRDGSTLLIQGTTIVDFKGGKEFSWWTQRPSDPISRQEPVPGGLACPIGGFWDAEAFAHPIVRQNLVWEEH